MEEINIQNNSQEVVDENNKKEEHGMAIGYAINATELFEEFNSSTLSFKVSELPKNIENKKKFSKLCFVDMFDMVLRDIIDNNATFVLPVPSEIAHMHMKKVEGDEFILARQRGAFEDIDFLKTNFTAYQLVLSLFGKKRFRVVRVTPLHLFDKIVENTNNGKQYC